MESGGRRHGTAAAIAIAAGLVGAAVGIGLERSVGEPAAAVAVTASQSTTLRTPAEIAAVAAPGVVSILATTTVESDFQPGSAREAVIEGSGLVLDKRGRILTSEHVVEAATKIHVSFNDGTKVHGTVLGRDPLLDLAVLEVDVAPATLHPVMLGSSDSLRLGDTVIAIGNPFGLERSVSVGVVSGLRRRITAPNGFTLSNAVQTDAAINHGNSGGPLLDAQGRVIGVNAQIAESGVDANVGVGFAVAVDAAVKKDIAQLRDTGKVNHPWVGISLDDIDAILATSGRVHVTEGALVTGVVAGGPAAGTGLRGGSQIVNIDGVDYCLGGDIVTAVGGRPVVSAGELQAEIEARAPGEKLTVSIVRAGGAKTRITVTLGAQPATAPATTTGCG